MQKIKSFLFRHNWLIMLVLASVLFIFMLIAANFITLERINTRSQAAPIGALALIIGLVGCLVAATNFVTSAYDRDNYKFSLVLSVILFIVGILSFALAIVCFASNLIKYRSALIGLVWTVTVVAGFSAYYLGRYARRQRWHVR